jgi:hypothetical protein
VRTLEMTFLVLAMTGVAGAAQAGWFSDESPPANAKPLSEIIKYQPDGKEVHIKVDPVSGAIR